MFWFGFPEVTGCRDLGDYRGGPPPRCFNIGDGVQRDTLLIVVKVEDRRAVAGADVVALTVLCCRVVDLEEKFQQGTVIGFGGVVGDLDRFSVSGVVAVGGMVVAAAGIADAGRFHTGQPPDEVLDAPEASARQNRGLGGHRCGSVSSESIFSAELFAVSKRLR